MRLAAGLSQTELAERAGVSRQLIGAVEAGRHLPRVDAALALARALGAEVGLLFPMRSSAVDVTSGRPPQHGAAVRVGRVGDATVTAPARIGADGWDVADAVVGHHGLEQLEAGRPGLVVAGCEPGLEVLERLLRQRGQGAVAVGASTAAARRALEEGRAHAAVVHGKRRRGADPGVTRFRLFGWRVGLAGPPEAGGDWWREALGGAIPVVQREEGAEAQRAFVTRAGPSVPGPRVRSHLQAARFAVLGGLPAVTIEPAALAVGARFHPLETHHAELWVSERWVGSREVGEALDLLTAPIFTRRLQSVGGYEMTGLGSRG